MRVLRLAILLILVFLPEVSTAQPRSGNIFVEAMEYFKGLPRQWAGSSSYDCKTYENKNIARLHSSFLVQAATFLSAFTQVHGISTVITSAHRNHAEQKCVCLGEKGPCARPGRSRHQSGVAIDVRAGLGTHEEYACMHDFARLNSRFGVHFPMGMRDRPHMEPRAKLDVRLASFGIPRIETRPCPQFAVVRHQILD